MKKMKAVTTMLAILLTASSIAACSGGGTGGSNPGNSGTGNNGTEGSSGTVTPPPAPATTYEENGLPIDDKVTLKVGFFEGGMGREWFDYAVETFTEKFPNVTFDITSSPKIDTITGTKISANDDADMFDLFSGGIPGGVEALVTAGKLESQEDLWDRKAYDGNGKTLKELALEGMHMSSPRVLGQTYALAIASTGAGLLYNKALFEQNGWNQNPLTWSEFLQLCEDIKAKGIIPVTFPGVYPGYIDNAFGVWKLFEIADSKGTLATVQESHRNYVLPIQTSPENIERWNKIYEMGQKGYFPEGIAALNHTQSQMQVIQERAAMVSTGTWVENEMKESAPEGFKWGFMAVPMTENANDTKWIRLSTGNGFYIWSGKPELNKKWAKEFNVWLWNLDIQTAIAEKGGMLPVRTDFMNDKERESKIQDAPRAMFEYMNKNKVMLESGFRNKTITDPGISQAGKVITEAITQIATGKQEPLPILQEAEELLKKAIEAQK